MPHNPNFVDHRIRREKPYSRITESRFFEVMNGKKKLILEGVRDFHLCISSVRLGVKVVWEALEEVYVLEKV